MHVHEKKMKTSLQNYTPNQEILQLTIGGVCVSLSLLPPNKGSNGQKLQPASSKCAFDESLRNKMLFLTLVVPERYRLLKALLGHLSIKSVFRCAKTKWLLLVLVQRDVSLLHACYHTTLGRWCATVVTNVNIRLTCTPV